MRRMMSAGCNPSAQVRFKQETTPAASAAPVPSDIIDTALGAGSFNKLISAVIAGGLGETLKGAGPFTVFAPTDAAFGELPAEALADLLKPENKTRLQSLLTYHVAPGRYSAGELVNTRTLMTANGQELPLRVDVSGLAGSELRGTLRVGEARVAKADIACTNGTIHVIDRVLMPASA